MDQYHNIMSCGPETVSPKDRGSGHMAKGVREAMINMLDWLSIGNGESDHTHPDISYLVLPSINLKKRNVIFPVDLVARGMVEGALGLVPLQTLDTLQIFQAKFTDIHN